MKGKKPETPVTPATPEKTPEPPAEEIKAPEAIPTVPVAEVKTITPPQPETKTADETSADEKKKQVLKAIDETQSREENLKHIQERLDEIMGKKPATPQKKAEEVKAPETTPVVPAAEAPQPEQKIAEAVPARENKIQEPKKTEEAPSREENLKRIQERLDEIMGVKKQVASITPPAPEPQPEEIPVIADTMPVPEEVAPIIQAQEPAPQEEITVPFVPVNDGGETTLAEETVVIPAEETEQEEPADEEEQISEPEITPPPAINAETQPKTFTEWLNTLGGNRKK
jgi:hypothetical protein